MLLLTTLLQAAAAAALPKVGGAIGAGIVALAAALGIGKLAQSVMEASARQPEIAGKINSAMMLGLVFIETAIIYALIVAILVIFVL